MSDGPEVDEALVARLQQAIQDLAEYETGWRYAKELKAAERAHHREVYDRLMANAVRLRREVQALTSERDVNVDGQPVDPWVRGFGPDLLDDRDQDFAVRSRVLDELRNMIRRALGAARDGARVDDGARAAVLRVFISHGGKTAARDKLEAFIRALGAIPVIVEAEPSLGTTPYTKVDRELRGCHYGVALATLERAAIQDGQPAPRGNVIDEAARLRDILGHERVLFLVESGVRLPTNITEFIREGFRPDSMDDAFTKLVTELRGLGMLRTEGGGQ